MIPSSVEKFLASRKGNVFRTNPASAATALKNLGVRENSQFGEFYLKYQGAFISPKDEPELLDIDDVAIPAIPDQTEYIKDVHEIPDNYLAEAWAATCQTFQQLDLQQRLPTLIAELREIVEPQLVYDEHNMSALDYRIKDLLQAYEQAQPPSS